MFLKIKDLPGEENARAQTDRADRVKRSRKNGKALPYQRAGDVKDRYQEQDKRKTVGWRKRVPMCRDEEQYPGAEEQPAERDRDQHRPAQPLALFLLGFIRADALRSARIDQAAACPSIKIPFPVGSHFPLAVQLVSEEPISSVESQFRPSAYFLSQPRHDLSFEEIERVDNFVVVQVADVEHAHEMIGADLFHLRLDLLCDAIGIARDEIAGAQ